MSVFRLLLGAGLLATVTSPTWASHTTAHHTAGAPRSSPAHPAHLPPSHDPQATRWLDVEGFGEVAVYSAKGPPRGIAPLAYPRGLWVPSLLIDVAALVSGGYRRVLRG